MNGCTGHYVLFTEHAKYSDGWEQIFSKAEFLIPEQQRQLLDQKARSLVGGTAGNSRRDIWHPDMGGTSLERYFI